MKILLFIIVVLTLTILKLMVRLHRLVNTMKGHENRKSR